MIGFLERRACRGYQAALLDFASERAGGPAVLRALDHVDRCRACEGELATTSLVLHALRRMHADTLRAEPPSDGWTRLRTRLANTRREPSRLLSGLPGIVAAAGLCAVLVGPGAIAGGTPSGVFNEAPRAAAPPSLEFEHSRERAGEEGLLPVPAPAPAYTGVRTAPPPIAADLPLSMRRGAAWIEEVVESSPLAVTTRADDGAPQRQAGRR